MGSPPQRPRDDMGGVNASLGKTGRDAADFLDRPVDHWRVPGLSGGSFGGRRGVGVMADRSHHGDVAADQKAPRPQAGERLVVFTGIEIGEVEIGLIMEPLALGPLPAARRCLGSFRNRCATPSGPHRLIHA